MNINLNVNLSDWVWLNDHDVCSATHLVEVSGLSNEEFDELVEMDVIVPVDNTAPAKSFQLRYVVIANMARRLRDDFELDTHGLTLAMTLVQRINELQEELRAMRAKLTHTISDKGEI